MLAQMPELTPLPEVYKSPLMLDVEAMFYGRDIRLVLLELYNALGSQKAVAKRLGLSQPTIVQWFKSLGLVIHQRNEARLDPKFPARPPPAPKLPDD
jgi:hypothetical protein